MQSSQNFSAFFDITKVEHLTFHQKPDYIVFQAIENFEQLREVNLIFSTTLLELMNSLEGFESRENLSIFIDATLSINT